MTRRRIFLWFLLSLSLLGPLLNGCVTSSPDDPHGDWVLISEQQARDMGREGARQLEKKVGVYKHDTYAKYIGNVGRRVASFSDRPTLDHDFKILDSFLVNAVALPGGFVYVFRGLLDNLENEAQLAAIMAHELAHVNAHHAVKRSQLQIGSILASVAAAEATQGRSIVGGMVGGDMIARGYTRSAEYQADKLGMKYLGRAGYDPRAMINYLEKLRKESERFPISEFEVVRTHPFLEDRIRRLRLLLARRDAPETPLVNRGRFIRNRRQFLYRKHEKIVLDQLAELVATYESSAPGSVGNFLCSDFRYIEGDQKLSKSEFQEELFDKLNSLREVTFKYQLLDLETDENKLKVTFSFIEERFPKSDRSPELTEGVRVTDWVKKNKGWCIKRWE